MRVHDDPDDERRQRDAARAAGSVPPAEARARAPSSPARSELVRLSRTAGNRAVAQLLARRSPRPRASAHRLQRKHVLPEDQTTAAARLQAALPGIAIKGNLTDEDDRFWETYMKTGSEPMTLEQFVESLLLGFLPAGNRTGVRIDLLSEGSQSGSGEGRGSPMSRGIRVKVGMETPLTQTDARPFSLNQVYTAVDGRVHVYVESVVAPGQGREFVTSSLLTQAGMLGVRRIGLRASMIGGSREGVYAWARYGFTPVPEHWNTMRRWGLEQLERLPGGVKATIAKSLGDPSPTAIRWIVHLSWKHPAEVKKFLDAMLDQPWAWDGDIDLDDERSRAWITRYASRVSDPAQYEKLLPELLEQGIPPPALEEKKPAESPRAPVSEEAMAVMVRLCVKAINSGDGTIEDVQHDYEADYPGIVARVRAHPDLKGQKAEIS